MIDDSLTIIIPTIGRPTLRQTLISIKEQIGPRDQIIVVGDGPETRAWEIVALFGLQFGYFELKERSHDWGASPRNFAIPMAKKGYVAFMDDDDVYLPGAFRVIRELIRAAPGRPLMFRMRHSGDVIWRTPELVLGNVSTQMVVLPNDQARISRWTTRYEGDFDFIESTAALYPEKDPFIWRTEVIAALERPNGKPDLE